MPQSHNLPHLIVPETCSRAEPFRSKGGRGDKKRPSPVADREQHTQALLAQIIDIQSIADSLKQRADLALADQGVHVEVISRPNEPLAVDSLQRRRWLSRRISFS